MRIAKGKQMKFIPLEKELSVHEMETDFEQAKKIGKWRVGERALFQTAGPFSIKYLPLSSITKAYPHDFQIKGGCSCAGTYPSRGVVIAYGNGGILKLIPNREKEADELIAAIKSRVPSLDTEIPERYRNETREKY